MTPSDREAGSNAQPNPRELVKISFVIGSLAVGGAETQLVRLVNHLDRSRFQPSIICLFAGGPLEKSVAADVPIAKVNLSGVSHGLIRSRPVLAIRVLMTLVRSLRRQRPDVVHAYLPTAYVLAGLAAWVLRVRMIVAGRRGLTSWEIYPTTRWRLLARIANRVIDVHLCNSYAVRDWAIEKECLSMERTRVIYSGIDLAALDHCADPPTEWRSNGPLVGMVANLIKYKGHQHVLEAVAIVARTHPSFRLVLIGDGPESAALQELAAQLEIVPNVIFGGSHTDAASFLDTFDFTVLGSSEEGFPNALMESMARGVPVVATEVGGVVELVRDGVDGLLVRFGDSPAMAEAIKWMIEHPDKRADMGQRARQRIKEHFTTDRMVTATQALYVEGLRLATPRLQPS